MAKAGTPERIIDELLVEQARLNKQIQILNEKISRRTEGSSSDEDADSAIKRLHAEKAERVRFFTIVAHDLRGPIGLIGSFADIYLSQSDNLSKAELVKGLNKLKGLSTRLCTFTESILSWASLQMDGFECDKAELDIVELLKTNYELFEDACDHKGIDLQLTGTEKSILLLADHDIVDAVIRNVISNAIKFTPAGGVVEIGVDAFDGYIEVLVKDNGVGMAQDTLERLFSPGAKDVLATRGTFGERGAGLGLLLCKELIGKNGGNISIRSEPMCGTEVTITVEDQYVKQADG